MKTEKRSMFFHIIAPIFLVSLLLFGVGAATAYSLYTQWYTDTAIRTNTEIIGQTASSLDIIHQHATKVSYNIYQNKSLQVALTEPQDTVQREWNARRMLSQLFTGDYTTIVDYEITIAGVNGISASSGNGGISSMVGKYLELPVFQVALERKGIVYTAMDSGLTYSTRDENVIVGCQPLIRDNGSVYGAIFISFTEENLRKFYKDFISNDNSITLLSLDGTTLSATDASRVGSTDLELLALCQRIEAQDADWLRTAGREILISLKLPHFDSFLVSSISLDQLLEQNFRSLQLQALLWGVVVLLLMLSIGWIVRRNLSPLQAVAQQMDTSGAMPVPIPNPVTASSAREIQVLVNAYNHMILKLQDYLERLEWEHQKQKQYELDLLQMQINPHFLYNTLDSVKYLVAQNDASQACNTIDSLISLLRNTLNASNELIAVEQEVRNAWDYINILKPRYGGRIAADIQMEDSCREKRIPSLILQPFIENAFFHAFQKTPGGRIRVSISSSPHTAGHLFCEIQDNGDGIPPGLLEELRQGRPCGKSTTRIGIQNVRERLEMLYPGQNSFAILSEMGYGVIVQMSFPADVPLPIQESSAGPAGASAAFAKPPHN